MAGSVQFRGIDQVMKAFENRDVQAWSIWQHKQFMFKGMGEGDLQGILEMIGDGSTNAIYTIKVYEKITAASDIKSNTPDDGSFNFRLNGDNQEITGIQYYKQKQDLNLSQRMEKIEQMLIDKEHEPEDEPETIGSVVMEVIKDPAKAMVWIDIIKSILSPGGKPLTPLPAAAMGNVNTAEITEDMLERIGNVIDRLYKNDAHILQHLEKLADISEKNPSQFKILLSMLDKM